MPIRKTALQNRKTLDPDPADHIAAGAVENPGTVGADHDEDLAELVWKYFGEEIGEALEKSRRLWPLNKAAQVHR